MRTAFFAEGPEAPPWFAGTSAAAAGVASVTVAEPTRAGPLVLLCIEVGLRQSRGPGTSCNLKSLERGVLSLRGSRIHLTRSDTTWGNDLDSRATSILVRFLGLSVTCAIVAYLVDWQPTAELLTRLGPVTFVWLTIVALGRTWFTSLRWRLLDPSSVGSAPQWDYFRFTMIGGVFGLVMPGALGGDLVRSSLVLQNWRMHRAESLGSLLVDRLVGLFSILALGTVACATAPEFEGQTQLLVILLLLDATIIIGSVGLYLPVSSRPFERAIRTLSGDSPLVREAALLRDGFTRHYLSHPWRVITAFLLCLPIHGAWFYIVYRLAGEIGIEVSFLGLSAVTAVAWLITVIPVSFGGLGVRELSFISLLGSQGVTPESATLLSLSQFGIMISLALIGVPFIWFGRTLPRETRGGQGGK